MLPKTKRVKGKKKAEKRVKALPIAVPTKEKAPKKAKPKAESVRVMRPAGFTSRSVLSPCAAMYAAALTDPHAIIGRLPCIPDALSAPSFKFATRSRFEFTIGSANTGGLAVWPMRMLCNNQVVNGATLYAKILATNSAYASTGAQFALNDQFLGAPAGVNLIDSTTSLFTQSDFASPFNRSARLVGSGVRIGYTGAVTNQRGTITFLRNSQPTSVLTNTFDDLNELLSQQDVVRINIRDMSADNANAVCYRPLLANDFSPIHQPLGLINLGLGAGTTMGRLGYVVLVTGGTPGDVYTADVVSFYETYGDKLPTTPSDADPVGHSSVVSSLAANSPSVNPAEHYAQILGRAARAVVSASGQSLPGLAGGAIRLGRAFFGEEPASAHW